MPNMEFTLIQVVIQCSYNNTIKNASVIQLNIENSPGNNITQNNITAKNNQAINVYQGANQTITQNTINNSSLGVSLYNSAKHPHKQ